MAGKDANVRFFKQFCVTPTEARKEIKGGRLKGMTDINPMWRIKALTEVFGPVGFGWWTQDEEFKMETCEATGETAMFCSLHLIVVDPETGKESKPILGVGGNKFIAKEQYGLYCNDEARKMAYTDALSIACKSLGFSSDIYFANDRTKYDLASDAQQTDSNTVPLKPVPKASKPAPVVTESETIPAEAEKPKEPEAPANLAVDMIGKLLSQFRKDFGDNKTNSKFKRMREELAARGMISNKPSNEMTVDEVQTMFTTIYKVYGSEMVS